MSIGVAMPWGRALEKLWSAPQRLRQTRQNNCVQTVLAMALELPISTVERIAGTTRDMELSDALEMLAQLELPCRPVGGRLVADWWPVFYRQSGGRRLRGIGCRSPRAGQPIGHAYLLSGSRLYDPGTGEDVAAEPEVLRELDWILFLPAEGAQAPMITALRTPEQG